MKSKSFKLLFLLVMTSPTQAASIRDCAMNPSPPAQTLGEQSTGLSALWQFGKTPVFEGDGGISLTFHEGVPDFNFASLEEKIIGVQMQPGASQFLILTRTGRGFSAYLWTNSSARGPLKPLVTVRLDDSWGNKTIASPLVDVYFSGDKAYLVSNFYFWKLNVPDLLKGTFNPVRTNLGGDGYSQADGFSANRARGVGFLKSSFTPTVSVMELDTMSSTSPAFEGGLLDGILPHYDYYNPQNYSLPAYTRFLPNHLINSGQSHPSLAIMDSGVELSASYKIFGEKSDLSFSAVPDYPIATGFSDPADIGHSSGAVSFNNRGTFLFRSGKAICRMSTSVLSSFVVELKADQSLGVQGLQLDGRAFISLASAPHP